jgi:predicted dehydrogenase
MLFQSTTFTRRNFLKTSVSLGSLTLPGLALPFLIPGSVLGKDGSVAPSNRITLGFAGVGMMNRGHLNATLSFEDVQVIALADPDQWRRETNKQTVENSYAKRKASGQFNGCDIYSGFHEMLSRSDIDGIVMALGERWHGAGVIMCAKAGKHVFVEKPNSYTIAEALGSIEAVRRYGVIAQVGFQQRSWANFEYACQVVRSGALGKIKNIYIVHSTPSVESDLPEEPIPPTLDWNTWLGPSPWRSFNHRLHYLGNPLNVVPWSFCKDLGLGGLGSGASHAFDIVHWGLGCDTSGPLEIIPRESKQVPYLTFKYPDNVTLQVLNGRLDPKVHEIPKNFDPVTTIKAFGAVFVGGNGWLHVGRQGYLKAFPAELAKDRPSRFEGHKNHVRNWLDSIRFRRRPACDMEIGSHSTIAAILGNIACWLGRPLKWDPVKNEFQNDDEANRLRSRAIREPWIV